MSWQPPTRDGARRGRDASTGMAWAFEEPAEHWAGHDDALADYWRARSPRERLAQASVYRVRVHGLTPEPLHWTWRFVPFGDE